jgi:hypothetical protein
MSIITATIPTQRQATAEPAVTPRPDGPPKLTHQQLLEEQQRTLDTPRRRYGIGTRIMFVAMDLLYGRARTLSKFRVLEIVARVPYQTWENVSYRQITRRHRSAYDIRRLSDRVREFRAQQDNEQWHLMILSEIVGRTKGRENRLWYDILPRLMAIGYWHFAWLLYVIRPAWSHRLNADFEDHAEHEYALLVKENPQWEHTPYTTEQCAEYGSFASLADVFRQIGHDERMHKQESELNL